MKNELRSFTKKRISVRFE
ncbi:MULTISPECIES: hypothetical protein [unclassified Microcoleus]